jgi:hypothetical protein
MKIYSTVNLQKFQWLSTTWITRKTMAKITTLTRKIWAFLGRGYRSDHMNVSRAPKRGHVVQTSTRTRGMLTFSQTAQSEIDKTLGYFKTKILLIEYCYDANGWITQNCAIWARSLVCIQSNFSSLRCIIDGLVASQELTVSEASVVIKPQHDNSSTCKSNNNSNMTWKEAVYRFNSQQRAFQHLNLRNTEWYKL